MITSITVEFTENNPIANGLALWKHLGIRAIDARKYGKSHKPVTISTENIKMKKNIDEIKAGLEHYGIKITQVTCN